MPKTIGTNRETFRLFAVEMLGNKVPVPQPMQQAVSAYQLSQKGIDAHLAASKGIGDEFSRYLLPAASASAQCHGPTWRPDAQSMRTRAATPVCSAHARLAGMSSVRHGGDSIVQPTSSR